MSVISLWRINELQCSLGWWWTSSTQWCPSFRLDCKGRKFFERGSGLLDPTIWRLFILLSIFPKKKVEKLVALQMTLEEADYLDLLQLDYRPGMGLRQHWSHLWMTSGRSRTEVVYPSLFLNSWWLLITIDYYILLDQLIVLRVEHKVTLVLPILPGPVPISVDGIWGEL